MSSQRLSGLNPIPLPQLKATMEASVPGATLSSQHAPCLINTMGTHTCTHYVSVNHVHTHTHTHTNAENGEVVLLDPLWIISVALVKSFTYLHPVTTARMSTNMHMGMWHSTCGECEGGEERVFQ